MEEFSNDFIIWKNQIEEEIRQDTKEMREINACEDEVYQKILKRLREKGFRFKE